MPKVKISSSQVDLAQTCPRRWWLKYCAKLKEPGSKNTILGDIGHGVCERWYDKEPLYPEGWELSRNRWTGELTGDTINKQEQALVMALIEKGSKDGTLTCLPDGKVEEELKFSALSFEGYDVTFTGFIDYMSLPARHIQDHKFCKDFKWYGQKKLSSAVAMNAYGYAAYEQGWIPKEYTVWLRYNLFRKSMTAPKTKKVEVEKSYAELEAFWGVSIIPTIKDTILYRKNAKLYIDVPEAKDRRSACQAFGQLCPFFDVCEGKETIDQYRARMNGESVDQRKDKYNNLINQMKETDNMNSAPSFMQNMEKAKAAQAGKAEPAAAPVAEASAQPSAPWAAEGCPSCANQPVKGMLNGNPCQVCPMIPNGEDKPPASSFDIIPTEGGYVFQPKAAPAAEAAPAPVPVIPEVATAPEAATPVAPAPAPTPVVPAPAPVVPEVSAKEFADYYSPVTSGFTLAYSRVSSRCRASKSLGNKCHIVRFGDFFDAVAESVYNRGVAQGIRAASFWELDTWKRKDAIKAYAQEWADKLGNSILEAPLVEGADEKALLSCIEPKAAMVFGELK